MLAQNPVLSEKPPQRPKTGRAVKQNRQMLRRTGICLFYIAAL